MLLFWSLGFSAFFLGCFVRCETPLNEDPLRTFSIYDPIAIPVNVEPCVQEITQYIFANSYGNPDVVNYTPPTGPGCEGSSWSRIVLNFTASVAGVSTILVQHDIVIFKLQIKRFNMTD